MRPLIALRAALVALALGLGGCATLPVDVAREASHAPTDTAATRLGQASAKLTSALAGRNAFRPLPDGVDALLARLALTQIAERSLDLQYYIWRDDLTGRHLAHALLDAADRGVRVRVLLDDVGSGADDDVLLALDAHPNIEIRLFNPVANRRFRMLGMAADFERTNRRMHNKAFVADNQAAILGGRNIGDEYFDAGSDVAFGDLDVLTLGPVVPEVSASFDRFWNAQASLPIAAIAGAAGNATALARLRTVLDAFVAAERDSPYVRDLAAVVARVRADPDGRWFTGGARLLYDEPDKIQRAPGQTEATLLSQFGNIGDTVGTELLVVSPYFIPGEAGVAWFRKLTDRGVKVTILTNSLAASDVGAVHSGYKRYREALLEAGVRLYELKPGAIEAAKDKKKTLLGASRASLHAKTFVFDRRTVFIGSLNLDARSVQLNTEIGLLCESADLAETIASGLERGIDKVAWRLALVADETGRQRLVWIEQGAEGSRTLTEEPETGVLRRLGVWFLGLLPIESQL
ncbi:phospholipase D family protein [Niveibacterium umoris]|uniref:Putative cardiolipin synthase n=1 Tax=Niveibacterium umoris TaxID=1193620 RepID=A0A840BPK7_9RHOO|nr:phospholipase D family protein [Niveibacterium umoris]MBB4013612.1 putative cardiolipin synthase [Niveibacterium umoris]